MDTPNLLCCDVLLLLLLLLLLRPQLYPATDECINIESQSALLACHKTQCARGRGWDSPTCLCLPAKNIRTRHLQHSSTGTEVGMLRSSQLTRLCVLTWVLR
jgi:hypothetical protein